MILHEWLLINGIVMLLSIGAFKAKNFPASLLLSVIAGLFLFKFAYTDVTYPIHPVVANTTEYVDASNNTITEYTYTYLETVTLDKNDLIYPYMAWLGLLLINLGVWVDRMRRVRK